MTEELSPRAQDTYEDQLAMGASHEAAMEVARDLDSILELESDEAPEFGETVLLDYTPQPEDVFERYLRQGGFEPR